MRVTVIMPMRNAAQYVRAALDSVLQERSVPLELVVVDDGSTDESAAIVRSVCDARVRMVVGPQKGIAACMNTGLAEARGNIIMRCDADDTYPTGRIARQLEWLELQPHWVAVSGEFQMMDAAGHVVARPFALNQTFEPCEISQELLRGELRTSLCTFAIKREALEQVGGFRSYFETAEDLDLAYRLGGVGAVGFVNELCLNYRIHSTSITHTQAAPRRVFFDDTARLFAQQRLTTGADDLMRGHPPLPPQHANEPPHSADYHLLSLIAGGAWRTFKNGDVGWALRKALGAVKRYPLEVGAWNLLLRLALKSVVLAFKRASKT